MQSPWVVIPRAEYPAYREALHAWTQPITRLVIALSVMALVLHGVFELFVSRTVSDIAWIAWPLVLLAFGAGLAGTRASASAGLVDASVAIMAFGISAYGAVFSLGTDVPAVRIAHGVPYLSVFVLLVAPSLRSALAGFLAQPVGIAAVGWIHPEVSVWPAYATPVAFAGLAVMLLLAVLQEAFRRRLHSVFKQLRQQAFVDDLTGLGNRRAFWRALEAQQAASGVAGGSALMVIDLDGFKQVNDTHGHAAGDEVLRRFARLLGQTARGADGVYRLGGDEFAVVLPHAALSQAQRLADRVIEAVAAEALPVGCSIGVVMAEAGAVVDALPRADRLMYRAKAMGGGRVAVAASPVGEGAPSG